ncbi:MAG: hypothetical protein PUK59_02210 [Actinomycetaceae bacterium]|nr:hypothetical protein [Actinomycetaceae bacterium]MDY5853974.1 hypothetical protein [Arcanobacterium sp.]
MVDARCTSAMVGAHLIIGYAPTTLSKPVTEYLNVNHIEYLSEPP